MQLLLPQLPLTDVMRNGKRVINRLADMLTLSPATPLAGPAADSSAARAVAAAAAAATMSCIKQVTYGNMSPGSDSNLPRGFAYSS